MARHDKLFGGERGAADRALEAMRKTYGRKKGEEVFRATVIKRQHKARKKKGGWL